MEAKKAAPLFFLVLVCGLLISVSGKSVAGTVTLNDTQDHFPLGAALDFFEDKDGHLTIEDIRSLSFSKRFKTSNEQIKNFGFTESTYWLRIQIDVADQKAENWYVNFVHQKHNYLDAYIPSVNGYEVFNTGVKKPFSNRDIKSVRFIFRLNENPDQRLQTLYFRVQEMGKFKLDLSLLNGQRLLLRESAEDIGDGFFFGAVLLFIGYNLVLGFYLREKSYLLYSLYLIGLMGSALTFGGGLLQKYVYAGFVWPELVFVMSALTSVSMLLLGNRMLNLRAHSPILFKMSNILIIFTSCWGLASLFLPPIVASPFLVLLIFPCAILMLPAGVYRWFKGYLPAKTYTLSWVWFLLAVFPFFLTRVLDYNLNLIFLMKIGFLCQMIFMSLAVAEQVNQVRRAKALTQKALLSSQMEAVLNLERADKIKDSFMSTVTHELLTPINAMRLSHSLLRPEVPVSAREYYDSAVTSNLKLFEIVESMITFTEARQGKLKLHEKAMNLEKALNTVFFLFKTYTKKDIEFKFEFDPSIPEWVLGDEKRLTLLVVKLLENAAAFTSEGSISFACYLSESNGENVNAPSTLDLGATEAKQSGAKQLRAKQSEAKQAKARQSEGAHITITVKDTGVGICESYQQSIFFAFSQIDSSVTREHGGLGIGLTIVKDLLRLMGGTLSLESSLGEGSKFSATLPIELPTKEQVLDARAEAVSSSEHFSEADAQKFKHATVLVVEDNQINMQLMLRLLERSEYKTLAAENGKDALALLKEHSEVSAILMDCQMPIMDGFEATKQIREMGGFNDIPIIAVTANTSEEDRQKCWNAGMNEYLAKPVNRELVETTLIKCLLKSSHQIRAN